ncbi:PREDICTED: BICD family-like cargo adapter 1 [Nelumbo nucifera]|uniref:BICD family-like cargo adapter 1 n=1 Tax=Nelumbo nucifera TaxID=4432 RepID=A0A1U8A2I3_NELNU|nr:PREDICTED: BICD family-like cargo adapter 1 [Nelumbo nucifera]
MVVNSSIHALTYQSKVNLKQALEAEESSRSAHSEFNLARNEINHLKNDARAKKELLTLLMAEKKELEAEKKELEEREVTLKRENENLEALVKEWTKILLQAMEDAKVKAVKEYKSSAEYCEKLVEAWTAGYREGFKLSRWLTRREFSHLGLNAITTFKITKEMMREPRRSC